MQMQPHTQEPSFMMKKEADDTTNAISISHIDNAHQEPVDISSSEKDDSHETDDRYDADTGKQLVVYDPVGNGAGEIQFVPQPIQCQRPSFMRRSMPSRVLPSVGAFTVQCANCFKWRLIPRKEKYEEIREHILEKPFYCEAAREWRPDISCDDPTDISQDGSRLWAIDKPNIAQPPPGWQRLLRIRGEGSTKFADVYYVAPSGKRLRSMVEVQKYLMEHPECTRDGVKLSQFSFQIPKPLQENYVRKRPARLTASSEPARAVKPGEGQTLAWTRADDFTERQLGRPPLLPPPPKTSQDSLSDPVERPPKKRRTPTRDMYSSDPVYSQSQLKVEEQNQLRNGGCGL